MVAANAMWQVVFLRLVQHLMSFQEAGGCTLHMQPTTKSVKCTFPGVQPEGDVVCVCGTCGSKRGIHQWVPLDVETVRSLPTMGLKSRSKFNSCAARRKALKENGKGKGKSDVVPIPPRGVSNPALVDIVPASGGEDSAAFFEGPRGLDEQQRVQRIRKAKLLRIPVVDSDIERSLVRPLANGSSSSNSSSSSSSSSRAGRVFTAGGGGVDRAPENWGGLGKGLN